jgi:UDP-N-acetylglucosamine:LPS N-acetylglucosamine transferase
MGKLARGAAGQPCVKVLAVASAGGHWVQLLRLLPAFQSSTVVFVTTDAACQEEVSPSRLHVVMDASRWSKLALVAMAFQVLLILLKEWPDYVVSTGAAPGYFALRLGRLVGARTVWVDSIANVDELSLSGRMVGKYADLWLTQWPHLATQRGPYYTGTVL